VDVALGERVTADTGIISVADLSAPLVEIYVDESDMAMLVLGYEAELSFDSIPDQVFTGKVVQIDPQITAVSGVNVLRGMIQLDADSFAKPGLLLPGMSASVDVIGGRATNAVLVPLEALRDLGDDQYAVFVMENGEPRLQVVEVGLRDVTYAEITSGLEGNETVTTGIVETN
jgi:HlyD family secretion protein